MLFISYRSLISAVTVTAAVFEQNQKKSGMFVVMDNISNLETK